MLLTAFVFKKRKMTSYLFKTIFAIILTSFLASTLLMWGCKDSAATKSKAAEQDNSSLIGTWRQTGIGKKQVSDIVVKLIFTDATLTMDAPGCMIVGDYAVSGDVLTYNITAVEGERCAGTQQIGESKRVEYQINDEKLYLKPLSGENAPQSRYKRIKPLT